jgi:hypothetical protein
MEIVHRWVKRHEDVLTVVPVHRLASAEEVLEWMKSLWKDTEGFHTGE